MADFSPDEIEEGRRLFAGEWNFLSAAASLASLPRMAGPEVAFAGRSNVGLPGRVPGWIAKAKELTAEAE